MNMFARRSRRHLVPAALVGAVILTAGGAGVVPAAHAAGADRVVVSDVGATERPTASGTRVQVTYTLTNHTSQQTPPRRVKLSLVNADRKRVLGRASVPALKAGESRTLTTTRLASPRIVEGHYAARVCYNLSPGRTCDTTGRRSVTIDPARLTPGAESVLVPIGGGEAAGSAQVLITNTGQARTGPISLALENSAPPESGQDGAAPSTDFTIDSTTCAGLVPGAQCTIDIARTSESSPTAAGRLVVSGARGSVTQVAVVSPARIEPRAYDYGDVAVGSSATKTLTFVNDSDQTISVDGGDTGDFANFTFDFGGPFTCLDQGNLPPGGSCTVTVRFQPQSPGSFDANGLLLTSAGLAPFRLSGTGTSGESPTPRLAGAATFGVTD